MRPIITVENVSKQYRLGTRDAAYGTLRDSLVGSLKAPFKKNRQPGKNGVETRAVGGGPRLQMFGKMAKDFDNVLHASDASVCMREAQSKMSRHSTDLEADWGSHMPG